MGQGHLYLKEQSEFMGIEEVQRGWKMAPGHETGEWRGRTRFYGTLYALLMTFELIL